MNKNNAILRDEIRIPNNGERNGVDKYNILYVDDHNLTLSYFNNSYGDKYNVIVANSPRDGFKILDKQPIDLVISDQDMPEISGIEFLKQISILHPEVGRVLLTKRNDVETLTSAINDANVNRFILKSCSVSTTKKAIDKVLDNIKLKNDNRILQEKLHALISQKNKTLEIQKKIFQLNIELNKKLESSLNIAEGNWQDALSEITEELSNIMDISRVGFWFYDENNIDQSGCLDMYSKVENKHTNGFSFDIDNFSEIINIVNNELIVQEENVYEPKSNYLPTKDYLRRYEIQSILYIPFSLGGNKHGILLCEQQNETRKWNNDDIRIILSITEIIKLSFSLHEKKLVEIQLNSAYRELKETHSQLIQVEKMASLGFLTAGIAHEINNPINFVYAGINALDKNIGHCMKMAELYNTMHKGDSENIVNQIEEMNKIISLEDLKTDIRSLVKDIRSGAIRISEIVKGLQNFSRIDEGIEKRVNIHEGIDSTLILLRSKFSNRINLIKTFDNNIPLIYCYPDQLNQVFMNLLSNAIQAIEGIGEIEIITTNKKRDIEIQVRDTGIGIPNEIQKNIFDPFFTTKDVGEGTGLGLSISYGIVEKHEGNIKVESNEGKGTTFIISLPKK